MWLQLIHDVTEVINKDAYVNLLVKQNIENVLENKKLYTKILYGVVENKKWIDFLLVPYTKGKRFKPFLKNTLRIGVYTLSYLSVAPFHVVNSLVDVVKKKDFKASKAINSILRSFIKDERLKKAQDEINKLPKNERETIIYNIDEKVLLKIKEDYPSTYQEILMPEEETYNIYRINFLKATLDEIKTYLDEKQIEYELNEETLITKQSLIDTSLFEEFKIVPQDTSSIMVAKVLNPPLSSTVLDVCSAPGSKTFHLSDILKNTGQIISCDIYEHKLKLIESQAKNLNATNITTKLADATNANYGGKFKYILVDAPCSGMGTMKHKGDLKLKLTIEKIEQIVLLQEAILKNVIKYLDDDGILVYSTCTINKDENEKQIAKLQKENAGLEILESISLIPTSKNDGFYICKLQKKR